MHSNELLALERRSPCLERLDLLERRSLARGARCLDALHLAVMQRKHLALLEAQLRAWWTCAWHCAHLERAVRRRSAGVLACAGEHVHLVRAVEAISGGDHKLCELGVVEEAVEDALRGPPALLLRLHH